MSRTDQGQEGERVSQAHFVEANKDFDSFYPEVTEAISIIHIKHHVLFVLLVTVQIRLVSNSLLISVCSKDLPNTDPTPKKTTTESDAAQEPISNRDRQAEV